MSQKTANSQKAIFSQILEIDKTIRFVGRIKDRKLLVFVRPQDSKPLLSDELSKLSHYQASVKASMDEIFDDTLGKTNWMITSRENVKLLTIFLEDGLLILSTEPSSDHDKIIKKIQSLNAKI